MTQVGSPHDRVPAKDGDADHIVDDGGPHHRTEAIVGVEYLSEQEEDAVEEDLRHGEEAEEDQRVPVVGHGGLAPRVARVLGEHLGRQQRRDDRRRGEQDEERGHDPVDERDAAVVVMLRVANDLRDQHRVQGAPGEDHVEGVGHQRRGVEGVGLSGAASQYENEQKSADKAEHPADERARRHDGRRVEKSSAGSV